MRLGRDFSVDDRAVSPKVAIVNETIARKYFAGQNPIGKHVGLGGIPDMEIVGIMGDTKYRALREAIPNTLYLPMDQAQFAGSERTLHIRTRQILETWFRRSECKYGRSTATCR